jgi:hypothetical protein
MIDCALGGFRLSFEQSGTLRSLALPDGSSVLHRCDDAFELGDGRVFRPQGWDECFPTIEACESGPVMGELVGLTPAFRRVADGVEQTWDTPRYLARRTFSDGGDGGLELVFRAESRCDATLAFLWASHALFSTGRLRSVALPDGQVLRDFSLDGTCRKFFVGSGAAVGLEYDANRLELETDQPYWGIWLNRGGWPTHHPAGFGCLGIEATNTPADRPRDARLGGHHVFQGKVVVRLGERRRPA